ncbi:MAG: hypothetical protein H8E44_15635 [Planctomycetes bacterium]|nr:hypothetical protein [Planctomycetota bacterium]MBL7044592.1 hypothetical protein [Pirellulaceae bacterium]
MSSHFQKPASFVIGCVFSAAVIVLFGAANNQADSPRYDADFDTIMGGLGGLTVEITDHNEQKAYLYVFPTGSKQKKDLPGPPQLVATIDLKSAGNPTLEATMIAREAKKKKED